MDREVDAIHGSDRAIGAPAGELHVQTAHFEQRFALDAPRTPRAIIGGEGEGREINVAGDLMRRRAPDLAQLRILFGAARLLVAAAARGMGQPLGRLARSGGCPPIGCSVAPS